MLERGSWGSGQVWRVVVPARLMGCLNPHTERPGKHIQETSSQIKTRSIILANTCTQQMLLRFQILLISFIKYIFCANSFVEFGHSWAKAFPKISPAILLLTRGMSPWLKSKDALLERTSDNVALTRWEASLQDENMVFKTWFLKSIVGCFQHRERNSAYWQVKTQYKY